MRNRPACPFFPIVDLKSRLRSRAHGREQIRVTRSKTALCVTFTVISPRKRSSFPFAYSLYFDTCTYLSESSLVHDLPRFQRVDRTRKGDFFSSTIWRRKCYRGLPTDKRFLLLPLGYRTTLVDRERGILEELMVGDYKFSSVACKNLRFTTAKQEGNRI